MKDEPTVSVVIPTLNRSASVQRELDALCAQTYPARLVEVIVVADGCTDETAEMVRHYRAPFCLRVIEQPNQGAAKARNHGAAHAEGQLLLFLDDDIEPAPSLIEAHARAHRGRSGEVVIGYLPPVIQEPNSFFHTGLRAWWEDKFYAMRQPGYRYSYRDLLSGNFSLEAAMFTRTGGFDTTFPCKEDYEFGMRLIRADAQFAFVEKALGYHHDHTDLDRWFRRVRQEGLADVMIGRRYPELRPTLPLARLQTLQTRPRHALGALAFDRPKAGDATAARLRSQLDLLERMQLFHRWQRLSGKLRDYWYWRGVVDQLGTRQALIRFLHDAPARADSDDEAEIEIDLRQGLEAAKQRLDAERPASVHIRYGRQPIGRTPPHPGAERLRGAHLCSILATTLDWPLLMALALEGVSETPITVDRQLPPHPVRVWEDIDASQSS